MTADGLSPVINYCYILVILFQLGDDVPYLLETHYSALLYTFISLHLKQQNSVAVFLSAITAHPVLSSQCHHSSPCSVVGQFTQVMSLLHLINSSQLFVLFFIMTCQKVS
jgi:hypothetical protein